jgi:23S rRNA (cytosine1962-C5)-methyltransferase
MSEIPSGTLPSGDTASRPTIRLQPSRHKRVQHGHPWVYSNEIHMDNTAKAIPPGTVVRVVTHDGAPLGTATFNPHTLICTRMLARDPGAEIDKAFLADRLRRALGLREKLFDRPYYRLIHAEADGLPALIVDRFGDVVVMQANSAGMDRLTPILLEALDEVLAPKAVVLRNDSPSRGLEGLTTGVRVASGSLEGPVRLEENGAAFFADPGAGQKTGWFYDQRDNRAAIAALARGADVIDFYSYNGGFAVQCARAGARSVVAVDRSEAALANGQAAAEANGVGAVCEFRRADAFEELERLAAAGAKFGVVIADPPAFVKSKKDLQAGTRAYRKMTRLAASITAPGGFLLVASCSHNVDVPLFAEQVARGLDDARRTGRILRTGGAAADHPVHPHLPETAYLKAQILQLD